MDIEPDLEGTARRRQLASLDEARDKLFWFLCGYFGGPITTSSVSAIPGCARAICLFHRRGRGAISG